MNYWLVKSEPTTYSWETFLKDGETAWEGVRNYAARNNLREMKKGDEVLFYHSNVGKEIVGIAKVSKTAYQDSTTQETAWLCVNLKPLKTFKKPVTLANMKTIKTLKEMPLIRIGRLSVMPISPEEFETILELSK
ncbi:MAG: EVE domain-containing protein [Bacteroidetes bacterium]|jgi:predicted RNA-binding protein with PUA-like domain|nr:EVE domain-containing protein [Bacteroidota bacterium]